VDNNNALATRRHSIGFNLGLKGFCQLAALELANDLLDLGRRTPTSPPHYLLFFDHETTSPHNRRAD
jgi:hypothetical protein